MIIVRAKRSRRRTRKGKREKEGGMLEGQESLRVKHGGNKPRLQGQEGGSV
jgi:hypothetical protein